MFQFARSLPYARMLAIVVIMVTNVSFTGGTSAHFSDEGPDLLAMLLRAPDYDLAGLDGRILRYNSTCVGMPQYAEQHADDYAMNPSEFEDVISGLGFIETCDVYHGLPTQQEAKSPPLVGFRSYVHQYADETGATDGFAFLEDESAKPTHTDIPAGSDVGDESEATVWSGEDEGGSFQAIDVTFRSGNITGGVTIWDYQDTVPDTETAMALAEVLLERVDAVMKGDAPNLGSLLAPMTGEGLPPAGGARYDVLNGEAEPRSGESAQAYQERVASIPAGAQNQFVFSQMIPPAEGDRPIQYGVSLIEFGTPDEAVAWVDETMQRVQAEEENANVVENMDVAEYGDASIAITYDSTANNLQSQLDRMYVAVDNYVVNSYFAYTTVPAGVIEAPTAIQVACIENGGCSDTVPVPEAFGGPPAPSAGLNQGEDESGSDESSTRSSIARIGQKSTSTEDRQQSGDDTTTGRQAATDEHYESDLYPFAIDYSDDWAMDDPQVVGDMEILTMSNGLSGVVIIVDTSHNGDVEACLDGALAYIEEQDDVSSIEVMEDENGDLIEGFSADMAYTAISYETADGSEMALYAECRTVAGGDATMEFNQFVPLDAYGDQIDAREELLAGIQIDN